MPKYADYNAISHLIEKIKSLGTITKITADNVRIWDLTTGIYQLPASCRVYYHGTTNTTSYFTLASTSILFLSEYTATYKEFYIFTGNTTSRYLYNGYSTSSSGTYSQLILSNLSSVIQNSQFLQKQADMLIEAGTTISNEYSITLPTTYTVGRNNLELYWNGQRLIPKTSANEDGHYQEVGSAGSSSSTIEIYRNAEDGDYTLTEDVHLHVVVKGKTIS